MKTRFLSVFLTIAAVFMLTYSCTHRVVVAPDGLPQNVQQSCTVSDTAFASWFKLKEVTENGVVTPANSVDFIHDDNCDFYQWSERMFLWMTSPDAAFGTVLASAEFYTVLPAVDSAGQSIRRLERHVPGKPLRAFANVSKTDGSNVEIGQAGGDAVLMDRNGELVYYISMVNDGYAQYLAAAKSGVVGVSRDSFPTTQAEVDALIQFAEQQHTPLLNPNTLAIEIKTSWVDVSKLAHAEEYVQIDAEVPTFKRESDTKWIILEASRKARLALVGIHIVGSANGHPEMIWATFEHKRNAPNAAYAYLNEDGSPVNVPAQTGDDWVFNTRSADTAQMNIVHMSYVDSASAIVAASNQTISPSNTWRTKPWGVAVDSVPNAEDVSPAASNSEILSINNSVLNRLKGNDVRKHYYFNGATWTFGGAAPNGRSYSPSLTTPGVAIGTSQLANSTMETYFQGTARYQKFGSCFGCHSGNVTATLSPDSISHIFTQLQPLKGR